MHKNFDMEAAWRKRCAHLRTAMLPGGHFFIDRYPEETAHLLRGISCHAPAFTAAADLAYKISADKEKK